MALLGLFQVYIDEWMSVANVLRVLHILEFCEEYGLLYMVREMLNGNMISKAA